MPGSAYGPRVQNRAISSQARLLAAVSELDASPAPATELAARRLNAVVDALVRSDLTGVCLGGEEDGGGGGGR